jgi:hypothetical protein
MGGATGHRVGSSPRSGTIGTLREAGVGVSKELDAQAVARVRGELMQMVFGHMSAQTVATAARLGLMDLIGDSGRAAPALRLRPFPDRRGRGRR